MLFIHFKYISFIDKKLNHLKRVVLIYFSDAETKTQIESSEA